MTPEDWADYRETKIKSTKWTYIQSFHGQIVGSMAPGALLSAGKPEKGRRPVVIIGWIDEKALADA